MSTQLKYMIDFLTEFHNLELTSEPEIDVIKNTLNDVVAQLNNEWDLYNIFAYIIKGFESSDIIYKLYINYYIGKNISTLLFTIKHSIGGYYPLKIIAFSDTSTDYKLIDTKEELEKEITHIFGTNRMVNIINEIKNSTKTRKAPIVSLDFFKNKINIFYNEEDEEFQFNLGVYDDLNIIEISTDNISYGGALPNYPNQKGYINYPCGYEILENGLPVLFINMGGDSDVPICVVIYWDGRFLKGYLPEDGNCFDKEKRQPYNHYYNKCGANFDEMKGDSDLIHKDVMKRISIIV